MRNLSILARARKHVQETIETSILSLSVPFQYIKKNNATINEFSKNHKTIETKESAQSPLSKKNMTFQELSQVIVIAAVVCLIRLSMPDSKSTQAKTSDSNSIDDISFVTGAAPSNEDETDEQIETSQTLKTNSTILAEVAANEEDDSAATADEADLDDVEVSEILATKKEEVEDNATEKMECPRVTPTKGFSKEALIREDGRVTPDREEEPVVEEEEETVIVVDEKQLILGEVLGGGGFGTVVKATYGGRTIAVKKFKEDDDEYDFSQLREATVLPMLTHKNIIGFVFSYPALRMMGLEFGGTNLRSFLANLKTQQPSLKASEECRLNLAQGFCEGMAFLHELDVAHRDIKAENVLVINGKVKICDFGLCQCHETRELSTFEGGSIHSCSPQKLNLMLFLDNYPTQEDVEEDIEDEEDLFEETDPEHSFDEEDVAPQPYCEFEDDTYAAGGVLLAINHCRDIDFDNKDDFTFRSDEARDKAEVACDEDLILSLIAKNLVYPRCDDLSPLAVLASRIFKPRSSVVRPRMPKMPTLLARLRQQYQQ